ncbi:phage holin [Sutcliffiella halmapala]|uniref:phage holin n=1 Tax=Sutcliffiella halmapala TaxID=79882 RepID=UPI000995DAF4|nr:phage holin [Sutcliffiella halmapala]
MTENTTTSPENPEKPEKPIRSVSKGAWFRVVFLVLALVNQVLVMQGKSPIPVSSEELEQLYTITLTIVASIIAWWKDNDWTKKARQRIK